MPDTDEGWRQLQAAAERLIAHLRTEIPPHVRWSARPSRVRRVMRRRVEDRLVFDVEFGPSLVEVYEVVRRRPLGGGPWQVLMSPVDAEARLRSGITEWVRDGAFGQ